MICHRDTFAASESSTPKNIWMIARDNPNATSGWAKKGTWTITPREEYF
jgi:hypothetical protein